MKKIVVKQLYVLVALVAIMVSSACTKFEEGPNFSLRSVKARITNTYRVVDYNVNGEQRANLPKYSTMKQFWNGDGVFTQTFINPDNGVGQREDGTWSLEANNTKIVLRINEQTTGQNISATSYTILKLSNKEMWLRSADNSTEWHLQRDY
jgi:hypothetical protein